MSFLNEHLLNSVKKIIKKIFFYFPLKLVRVSLIMAHWFTGRIVRFFYLIKNKINHNSIISKVIFSRSQNINEFWHLAHKTSNTRWLTGTNAASEFSFLDFDTSNKKYKNILVVGLGKGKNANLLAKLNFNVDVLDITHHAFSNLNSKIVNRYLADKYVGFPENKYDLVLHHLVAQHMSNSDLDRQLEKLINSLKDGGEIRMQFATALKQSENDISDSLEDQKLGQVLRSKDLIKKLLSKYQNITFEFGHFTDFPNWENGWRWNLLLITKVTKS